MEVLLRDAMNELTNPTLAPYAKTGEVELRTTAKADTEAEAAAHLSEKGIAFSSLAPLGEATHIFTHLEWHMTGYEILLDGSEKLPFEGCFFAPDTDLDTLYAIPSAYRAYRPFM